MYYFNPGLWYLGLFFTVWATREAFFYIEFLYWHIKQFSYVVFQLLSHVQLCNLMNCSTPGFPVHHHLLELAQTHVHQVSDATQPSCTLSSPSPPAFNLPQHQGLLAAKKSLQIYLGMLKLGFYNLPFPYFFVNGFPFDSGSRRNLGKSGSKVWGEGTLCLHFCLLFL